MKLSVHDPKSFPWYLGHICKTWRAVFLTSPRFWCTLNFRLPSQQKLSLKHFERALELTMIGIQRSKSHPISFKFNLNVPINEMSFDPRAICCRKIFETIMAHSARWRDVSLAIPVNALRTLYGVKHRLPMLRSIQARVLTKGIPTTYSDLFTDAPRLAHVSTSGKTQTRN
jgi:hypothetical protein